MDEIKNLEDFMNLRETQIQMFLNPDEQLLAKFEDLPLKELEGK